MSKQVKNTVAVLAFFDQQKGSVTSKKKIAEQPILLTKSNTDRPDYKFSKYFRKKRAVKSRTRSRPCPRI